MDFKTAFMITATDADGAESVADFKKTKKDANTRIRELENQKHKGLKFRNYEIAISESVYEKLFPAASATKNNKDGGGLKEMLSRLAADGKDADDQFFRNLSEGVN